jgi:hypothetical protein
MVSPPVELKDSSWLGDRSLCWSRLSIFRRCLFDTASSTKVSTPQHRTSRYLLEHHSDESGKQSEATPEFAPKYFLSKAPLGTPNCIVVTVNPIEQQTLRQVRRGRQNDGFYRGKRYRL